MASSKMMIPIAYMMMMVALFASYGTEASIGINWGRESPQRLVPSQVVDLLLQNGIGRARIYTSQDDVLAAFAGSGINLTVSILKPNKINSKEAATTWVQSKHAYLSISNIRSVFLGGYVFDPMVPSQDKAFRASALNALRWLQEALTEQGFGDVKANFLNYESILKPNKTKPSEAEFIDEIIPEMMEYLQFLQEHDALFQIEHMPLVDVTLQNFDTSFAFPDNASSLVINDINGAAYTNVFQWRYDCYLWALRKLNASDVRVDVSMVGWPTDGYPGATAATAERFYKHFLPLVAGNQGTPMRPGVPIDVNVHTLTDEHKMMGPPFTRHWGIYRSNGEPKYKIDLTGRGRDIYPTTAKGIMRMPSRWCVFNGDRSDLQKVKDQLNVACTKSDCTSTLPGGSCCGLTFEQNVTYAFNMFFQSNFQDEKACNFDGLGHVSVDDPSTEECLFPVEVVRGQQLDFKPPSLAAGEGFRQRRPSLALFIAWLSILGEILLLV